MLVKVIAVFLIFFFLVLIAITAWSFTRIHQMGMLKLFLQDKWLGSLLSGLFVMLFLVGGVALLMQAEWAVPVLRYTIYGWLVYVWLYGLKKLGDMILLLRYEKAKSMSQFVGRSKFFDELIAKTIVLSKRSQSLAAPATGEGTAVSDSSWEAMLDDEALFGEIFHQALRKRIRRRVIGLVVHTFIFLLILLFDELMPMGASSQTYRLVILSENPQLWTILYDFGQMGKLF